MFVRNKTNSHQMFKAGKTTASIRPGGFKEIPDVDSSDPIIKSLIDRGVIEKMSDAEGNKLRKASMLNEASKSAAAKKNVKSANVDTKSQWVVAKCWGQNDSGKPCGASVNVPLLEYRPDKPCFCDKHAGENPDDYELVNGVPTKKSEPEPEPEPEPEKEPEPEVKEEQEEDEFLDEEPEEEKPAPKKRTRRTTKTASSEEGDKE